MADLDPVALTQALVRVDTVNPPGHEDGCITLLADLLSAAGFQCRVHDFAPRRSSLVARIAGASGADKRLPLAFTGHVDVVPLGAAPWQHDPFGGDVVEGRLYGRGSSDMKSGVAAFVCAAIAQAERLRDGPGLSLILTAGEETGCEGAFAMARDPDAAALLGRAGALVVAEPTANAPLVGHKGAFWLKAQARGVTAHGSMPEQGDNAIYKIARAALALEQFAFETPAHPLMGAPTLNVGNVRGGLNINSVPDAAELGIDIRSVAGQDHARVLQCLCTALGEQIHLSTMLDVASVYTTPDDPWMQRVFALCAARQGAMPPPRTVSYFTDAAALRLPLGMPPVLILGPGEPQLAHQTDEYCRVHRIHEATALFDDLITDWCRAA
ncbi:MAG: M20 family metallopeptidase [Rubrivivax sp.]|nr:M20 family metallopeptidase [Rubrivivax sp.]